MIGILESGALMDLDREVTELKVIASLYRKRGQLPLALEILKTARRLQTALHGPCADVAVTTYQLAEIYSDMDDYRHSRPLYEEAVDMWRDAQGTNDGNAFYYAEVLMQLQNQSDWSLLQRGQQQPTQAKRDSGNQEDAA